MVSLSPSPFPTVPQFRHAASIVLAANEPVFGRYVYRDLVAKVSYVFYELIKQHVFFNGNKRIATYFLLYLLEVHGYMLETDRDVLATFALKVADSDPGERDKVMRGIRVRVMKDTVTLEAYVGRDPWSRPDSFEP